MNKLFYKFINSAVYYVFNDVKVRSVVCHLPTLLRHFLIINYKIQDHKQNYQSINTLLSLTKKAATEDDRI